MVTDEQIYEESQRVKANVNKLPFHDISFQYGGEYVRNIYEEKLRWIPVEEKLPNEYDFVIAKSNLGDYYISSYSFNTFHVNMPFKVIITHWRQINIE